VFTFKSQTDFSRFSRVVWTVSSRFPRVLDGSLTLPKRIDEFGMVFVEYATKALPSLPWATRSGGNQAIC
jgi:hypothetical protein